MIAAALFYRLSRGSMNVLNVTSLVATDLPLFWPRPVSMLPRRLLDLSRRPTIVLVDVPEWATLGLCIAEVLSEYWTLSYETYSRKLIHVVNIEAIPTQSKNLIGNLSTGRLKLRGRPLRV
jgi:hypothetical protein